MSPAQSPLFQAILKVDVSSFKLKSDVIEFANRLARCLRWHTLRIVQVGKSQLINRNVANMILPSKDSFPIHQKLEPCVSARFFHLKYSHGVARPIYLVGVKDEM